jgi:hypothetical protein
MPRRKVRESSSDTPLPSKSEGPMDPDIIAGIAAALGQQLFSVAGGQEPIEPEEFRQTEEEEAMDAISNYCMIGRASQRFHVPYELIVKAWLSIH